MVNDIEFDSGPYNTTFDKDGVKMTIADYFWKTYQLKVTEKKQPMLIVNGMGKGNMIPSEFCLLDGVP